MKHTKSDMCTGTGALDTRNTVQKHQLTSTCLEEMQVMMHVNMALQLAELATLNVAVSFQCCKGVVHLHCY